MSGPDDEIYTKLSPGESQLITDPDYALEYTGRRETDCWSALARGLIDYASSLVVPWHGGELHLRAACEGWAEPEQLAKYPGAAVYSEGQGLYDADSFSTYRHVLKSGQHLQVVAEFVQTYTFDVWCTHPKERSAMVAMFEDAFSPVDWEAGFRLTLPHYHGAVGSYLKEGVTIADSAEQAGKRWRLASFTITGTVPQIRFIGQAPTLTVRTDVTVTDA